MAPASLDLSTIGLNGTNFTRTTLMILLLALSFIAGTAAAAEWAVVHAGKLLDQPGESVSENQSVVIKDGRIDRIVDGFLDASDIGIEDGDNVSEYDLSDYFVLPGFIDSHTHLSLEISQTTKLERVELSDPYLALRATQYAARTLAAGFTTVRNVGGGSEVLALRDAVAEGFVDGPRIFAVGGSISATGGHGDVQGYRAEINSLMEPPEVCDGPAECRHSVRLLVRNGADLIKIALTGGVLSETAAGLNQQMFDDEIVSVVETAHGMGRKVAAHAHGTDGINAALRAGVDSIEHGTFLDEESIKLFKESGAYLVPTLLAPGLLGPMITGENSMLPGPQREKALMAIERAQEYAREAHEAGVKIAFGTDAGVYPHGMNGKEFRFLVEWAGMSPMEAIHSATVNAADLLGQSSNLGTLSPGKFADMIAVKGDPLDDITELEDIDFVMKEGAVYKAP